MYRVIVIFCFINDLDVIITVNLSRMDNIIGFLGEIYSLIAMKLVICTVHNLVHIAIISKKRIWLSHIRVK